MLRKVSIILALVVSHINIFLAAFHNGYFMGYNNGHITAEDYCNKWCESYRTINGEFSFSMSGYQAYDSLNFSLLHYLIALPLVLLLVGKFIKKEFWSRVLCLTSLILALTGYVVSFSLKYYSIIQPGFLNEERFAHLHIINNFIKFDLACSAMLILLLVFQIRALFRREQPILK